MPVWPLMLAIVVTAFLWQALSVPRSPPTCMDGWRSPSIGVTGACSHHGGVKHEGTDPTPLWKRGVAIGAGAATFLLPMLWYGVTGHRRTLKVTPIPLLEDATSRLLQAAIDGNKRIRFTYSSVDGKSTRRTVQPNVLAILEPFGWKKRSLSAFCYLRDAERVFLLHRMTCIEIID